MPMELDARKKPREVKVHVTTGAGVDIVWSDGHASHYEFAYLREQCPCALCNDEREKKATVSKSGGAALPMFKAKAAAASAKAVGNYAIHIAFTDGHSTGIYSFEHLREICPCEQCGREFRGGA